MRETKSKKPKQRLTSKYTTKHILSCHVIYKDITYTNIFVGKKKFKATINIMVTLFINIVKHIFDISGLIIYFCPLADVLILISVNENCIALFIQVSDLQVTHMLIIKQHKYKQ